MRTYRGDIVRTLQILVALVLAALMAGLTGCGLLGSSGRLFRPEILITFIRLDPATDQPIQGDQILPGQVLKFRILVTGTNKTDLDSTKGIEVFDPLGVKIGSIAVSSGQTDFTWTAPTDRFGKFRFQATWAEDASVVSLYEIIVSEIAVVLASFRPYSDALPVDLSNGLPITRKVLLKATVKRFDPANPAGTDLGLADGSMSFTVAGGNGSMEPGISPPFSGVYVAPNVFNPATRTATITATFTGTGANAGVVVSSTFRVTLIGVTIQFTQPAGADAGVSLQQGEAVQVQAELRDSNGDLLKENTSESNETVTFTYVANAGEGTYTGSPSSGPVTYTAPATQGSFDTTVTSGGAGLPVVSKTLRFIVKNSTVQITSAGSVSLISAGGTLQLTATLLDGAGSPVVPQPTDWTWSVVGGAANGTVTDNPNSNTETYTAPATAGQYTVQATPAGLPGTVGSFNVAVSEVFVNVLPTVASVVIGGELTFTATVTSSALPDPPDAVTWSSAVGSITGGGVFTAPTTPGGPFTVTATSTAIPGKTGTSQVYIVAPGGVTVAEEIDQLDPSKYTPALNIMMPTNSRRSFVAAVPASFGDTSVTWTKQSGVGAITVIGNLVRYDSGGSQGSAILIARSVADPTKFAMVTITVSNGTGTGGGVIK
ncbi:MAG: hypothetical protein L6Q31_08485 [Fimbriimonadaceae bacterium]|nr:hypothetical protein [Fimbriimonadaceae bacterium]NUM38174.1 hypothetical protein [Armatimonadota bacterium]GIK33164.1 MAG: hypothetical protein BroJett009_21560 [Armatimonadota bacterium]